MNADLGKFSFYFVRPFNYVNEQMVSGPLKPKVYGWYRPTLDTPTISANSRTDGVYLSWTPVRRATGYRIDGKTGDGEWFEVITTADTNYLHTDAAIGIETAYNVTALYSDGDVNLQSATSHSARGYKVRTTFLLQRLLYPGVKTYAATPLSSASPIKWFGIRMATPHLSAPIVTGRWGMGH